MTVDINKMFEDISIKLFKDSLNYYASFKLFPCNELKLNSLEHLIKSAFGEKAVLGGSTISTKESLINELRNALQYRGEQHSHPSLEYLDSPDSVKDFEQITTRINHLLDKTTSVIGFWLKEGHPFYPVFWDFAYLIETSGKAPILLIASSSD